MQNYRTELLKIFTHVFCACWPCIVLLISILSVVGIYHSQQPQRSLASSPHWLPLVLTATVLLDIDPALRILELPRGQAPGWACFSRLLLEKMKTIYSNGATARY